MKYQNFMCPYELALKLHELGVNSESEFYFVKEMKGGGIPNRISYAKYNEIFIQKRRRPHTGLYES